MAEKTTKQELHDIKSSITEIKDSIVDLCTIEIVVTNGTDKHIRYHRNEFFQMLYDRKNVWKEKVRLGAKDIMLFIGVLLLILNDIFGIL